MVCRTRRRLRVGLLAALVVLAGGGCGPRPPMEITILHTNDLHGKFRPTAATWKEGNPPIGGFANLSAYIETERAGGGRTLLLDAGDLMTGNPICNMDYEGVQGGAMMEFMNRLGYDAMAVGNHEFDHGLDNLSGLLELARFPVLSANTYRPDGSLTAPERYHVFDVDGLRVGVIGLMTEDLYGVAAPSALAGTRVTSAAEAAREIVARIDPKTDLIVLLTHIGVDGDRELAQQVPGIDVIVGGHSHTRLTQPEVVNGVLIVQTGAHDRNLGRLHLTVQGDSVAAYAGRLIELWPRDGGREDVRAMVDEYAARIDREYGEVIGRLATAWRRSSREESNVGDWIAEQFQRHAGADFGLINSGGIRKNMPAGPVTRLDVLELLPFANVLTTFTCTGAEVLQLMKTNAAAAAQGGHGILQVAGLRYAYAVRDGDVEIVEATVGGKPVDPQATYTGVGVDFVVLGNARRYLGFEPRDARITGALDAEVIEKAIRAASGPIDARADGRIRAVEGAGSAVGAR